MRQRLALLLTVLLASAVGAQTTRLSPQQWREDLAFLASTIKAVHPAPFHRYSEARFDSAVRALDGDIPRLGARQIALRMMGIIALVSDGHTQLPAAAPVFARDRAFPIRIDRFVDGIYVDATRADDREILGAKVMSIGGRPAQAVWDSLAAVVPGDNDFLKMNPVPVRLTTPEVVFGLGLADSTALALELQLADGRTVRRSIPAVAANGADVGWYFGGRAGPAGASETAPGANGAPVDLPFQNRRLPYWFVLEGRTLYAQINQVGDSRDTVSMNGRRGVVSLGTFAETFLAAVDSGNADRLVIDLRYNGGGNNFLARPVVAAVAARPAINAKGRLFVITGRQTYSAAMNFTSMFEERTNAIFVGEPPGGSPSHYGDATEFALPHSKLVFRVSTLHWTLGVDPTDVREVMEPHVWAPPRFADYRAGKDPAMDAIRAYKDGDVLSDRLVAVYADSGIDAAMRWYQRTRGQRNLPQPWGSDVQQLLRFANALVDRVKYADAARAYDFATEMYPDSHVAWAQRGLVHGYIRDWPEVKRSYARAHELRPQNELIGRMLEAAKKH